MSKRIAIIGNSAFSLYNFRRELIAELVGRDLEVLAFAPDFDAELEEKIRSLGASPVTYKMSRASVSVTSDLSTCVDLYRLLKKLKPDLVLSYFMKPVIYGTMISRLAGVKRSYALVEGLGYVYQNEARARFKLRMIRSVTNILYLMAFRVARKVFFLNSDDIDYFVHRKMIAPSKVVNLGGIGVDLQLFSAVEPVARPVTFLLMARLLRQKGIFEFAEAAALVKTEYPDTRFILLGGTDPNPDSITDSEIRPWVDKAVLEWPGSVSDVRLYLRQSSVYVLPSYYREGVPRSTQEAMAMGLPVITTDNVGCRDTVENGISGFLVPIRDVHALAEAMKHFVRNPDLIASMGRASRSLAEERFDVRKINQRVVSALDP